MYMYIEQVYFSSLPGIHIVAKFGNQTTGTYRQYARPRPLLTTPINYFLWLTQLSEWNVNTKSKIKQCLGRWPCCCSRSNEQSGSFFTGREKFRGEFDVTATIITVKFHAHQSYDSGLVKGATPSLQGQSLWWVWQT